MFSLHPFPYIPTHILYPRTEHRTPEVSAYVRTLGEKEDMANEYTHRYPQ